MAHQCNFCHKVFSSKCVLVRHQRTAKFCLKIQSSIQSSNEPTNNSQIKNINSNENINPNENKIYKCNYCNYITPHKFHLDRHLKSCRDKKKLDQEQIKELKDELLVEKTKREMLEKDKDEFKKEAFKPKSTTVNNNVTLQMKMDYCKKYLAPYEGFLEHVGDKVNEHLRLLHVRKGVDGVIIVLNKMLPPTDATRYLVTFENSKQSFYRNSDNKIELDDKANKFLTEVFPFIRERSTKLYNEEWNSSFQTDPKGCTKLADSYTSILRIGDVGSPERKKCVNAIADSFCISNTSLKNNMLEISSTLLETEAEPEIETIPKITEDNDECINDINTNIMTDSNSVVKNDNNMIDSNSAVKDDRNDSEIYPESQPWHKVPRKYKSAVYSIMMARKNLQTINVGRERCECISMIELFEQDLPKEILEIVTSSPYYKAFVNQEVP